MSIDLNQLTQCQPLTVFDDGHLTRASAFIIESAPVITRSVGVATPRTEVFDIGGDRSRTGLRRTEVLRASPGAREMRFLPGCKEMEHDYTSHDEVRVVLADHEPMAVQSGSTGWSTWRLR